MQSHRHVQLKRRSRRATKQFRRAGFDPIGRQHGTHEASVTALVRATEGDGRFQSRQSARFVEIGTDCPGRIHHLVAAAIGGAEIDPQPKVPCDVGGGGEFLRGLAPLAVEQ